MAFTKSQEACAISKSGIEYLCGLIRDINGLDTNLIDDLNIKSNGTFSSVRINTLLNALKTDCNDFANSLVSNLSRLELKIVTDEADMIEHNKLYLIKKSGETSYSQYVIITNDSGVDEKVLLGTTDINMSDYYTITQADTKFTLKTDFDALKTEVTTLKTKVGTDTLNTTSQTVTGAINELNDKSTMVTLTQAEYNQLVADGTIDNDTYYIISDDSENLDLNKYNIKTYTSLNQLGLTTPISVGDLFVGLPDNSLLRIQCDNDVITGVPHKNGVLIIDKCSSSKFSIEFKISAGGSVNDNTLYIGQLKGVDGTGLTWSRVCTTKVADVGKTNITSRVSNATVNSGGGVSYSVKNGICYVQIQGIATTVASNSQRIIINSNIPNPDYELTNGHYTIVSPNATNGLVVFDGKGGIIYYGGAMTIYTTVSYPVKES